MATSSTRYSFVRDRFPGPLKEKDHVEGRNCPEEKANLLSRMFFWWINPLFWRGFREDLEVEDLWDVPRCDESRHLGNLLENNWEKCCQGNKSKKESPPSLLKAVLMAFGRRYLLWGIVAFLEECVLRLSQPILMAFLIQYFDGKFQRREGIIFAVGIVLCSAFYCVTHHTFFFAVCRMGMQVRVACCSLIYRKAVRLSQSALSQTTVGQMVNLLSNDVNRFDQSLIMIHYLWVGPFQTIISAVILWKMVGPACLSGYVVLFLLVILQSYMGKIFSRLRQRTAAKTDERIRLMSEILDAMKVIKMYAWEKPFAEKVDKARREEIKVIRTTSNFRGFNMSFFFASGKIILLVSFATLVATGNAITAEKVFLAVSLFNNVRLVMTLFFPFGIAQAAETLVSLKRIEEFLLLPERVVPIDVWKSNCSANGFENSSPPSPRIDALRVADISAAWEEQEQKTMVLSNISFTVKPGELVAIVGAVGAGKSSLLNAILRELPLTSGEIHCPHKIGYVSQEPWVFSGTIQDNILLGRRMDTRLFPKVIHACALDKDLHQFPQGKDTFVGDKGITLSGGQKARLSLARALYQEADVYLLDDPLSAVDADVGRHLFDFCIMKHLKDKARVLVTHQLHFLSKADKIIVLSGGKIHAKGSLTDLLKVGVNVTAYMAQEDSVEDVRDSTISAPAVPSRRRMSSILSATSTESVYAACANEAAQELRDAGAPKSGPVAEAKAVGSLSWRVYWVYFRAGASYLMLFWLLTSNIVSQVAFSGSDVWLARWTEFESERMMNMTLSPVSWYKERQNALLIYVGIILTLVVFSMLRTYSFFKMCMDASATLHSRMFHAILRAPMKFFDENPVGRTLNRFSRDTGNMDDLLPTIAIDVVMIFLVVVAVIIVISLINPWILIPSGLMVLIFAYLRQYYIVTSRQIKRMEGVTRSPVFSHLSATLQGLATIRACRVEDEFCLTFDELQDEHSKTWFLFISTTRWFGIWLEWLMVFYISSVVSALMGLGDAVGGDIGLVISSATTLTGMFQWGVRQSAELENQMTSVERIVEYANLPSEKSLESQEDKRPPSSWPQNGAISLNHVFLAYDSKPGSRTVLNDLNFEIGAQENVGIVGRTGAGKSSFIAALFRLAEPTGQLLIDDVDVQEIGLHDLRKRLSIIPQEPVLFSGTLRQNLDPFGSRNDDELWGALAEVQLKAAVLELSGGLDAVVTDRGNNFSIGQRQLICLARAILNKNKILILDEATANVDLETDQLIQETLRTKFSNCTTITIAHRLDTIIDSDRIVVLDGGRLQQFSSPYELLQDKTGTFHKLVEHAGQNAFKRLYLLAAKVYEKKTGQHVEVSDSKITIEASKQQPVASIEQLPFIVESSSSSDNDRASDVDEKENIGDIEDHRKHADDDEITDNNHDSDESKPLKHDI